MVLLPEVALLECYGRISLELSYGCAVTCRNPFGRAHVASDQYTTTLSSYNFSPPMFQAVLGGILHHELHLECVSRTSISKRRHKKGREEGNCRPNQRDAQLSIYPVEKVKWLEFRRGRFQWFGEHLSYDIHLGIEVQISVPSCRVYSDSKSPRP